LFKKLDKNGDNKLSYLELKTLLEEIKLDQLTWDWEKVMDILIDEFDRDDDKDISYEEFHDGVTKWIEEIKGVLNEPNHSEALSKVL
nr:hypothetical protein [Tanacetum cinerariifolium]